ncbi:MAG TPA: hypothetical protein V6D22_22310 [Candidatus Obscuribacterales bacterium]
MSLSSGRSRMDLAVAAILALSCTVGIPAAKAQVPFTELDKQMDTITKGKNAGDILSNQKLVRANIDTRISQLRSQISIATARHWLTPQQMSALSQQLDMVQSMQTRARSVGLTVSEARDLVDRLRTVEQNVSNQMASTGKIQSDHISSLTNLENQRLYLQSRIDQGLSLGRLSPEQVQSLRQQMAEIRAQENRSGGLTPLQQDTLRRRMAALNARINGYF